MPHFGAICVMGQDVPGVLEAVRQYLVTKGGDYSERVDNRVTCVRASGDFGFFLLHFATDQVRLRDEIVSRTGLSQLRQHLVSKFVSGSSGIDRFPEVFGHTSNEPLADREERDSKIGFEYFFVSWKDKEASLAKFADMLSETGRGAWITQHDGVANFDATHVGPHSQFFQGIRIGVEYSKDATKRQVITKILDKMKKKWGEDFFWTTLSDSRKYEKSVILGTDPVRVKKESRDEVHSYANILLYAYVGPGFLGFLLNKIHKWCEIKKLKMSVAQTSIREVDSFCAMSIFLEDASGGGGTDELVSYLQGVPSKSYKWPGRDSSTLNRLGESVFDYWEHRYPNDDDAIERQLTRVKPHDIAGSTDSERAADEASKYFVAPILFAKCSKTNVAPWFYRRSKISHVFKVRCDKASPGSAASIFSGIGKIDGVNLIEVDGWSEANRDARIRIALLVDREFPQEIPSVSKSIMDAVQAADGDWYFDVRG